VKGRDDKLLDNERKKKGGEEGEKGKLEKPLYDQNRRRKDPSYEQKLDQRKGGDNMGIMKSHLVVVSPPAAPNLQTIVHLFGFFGLFAAGC